jgi:hypothetical protein
MILTEYHNNCACCGKKDSRAVPGLVTLEGTTGSTSHLRATTAVVLLAGLCYYRTKNVARAAVHHALYLRYITYQAGKISIVVRSTVQYSTARMMIVRYASEHVCLRVCLITTSRSNTTHTWQLARPARRSIHRSSPIRAMPCPISLPGRAHHDYSTVPPPTPQSYHGCS